MKQQLRLITLYINKCKFKYKHHENNDCNRPQVNKVLHLAHNREKNTNIYLINFKTRKQQGIKSKTKFTTVKIKKCNFYSIFS